MDRVADNLKVSPHPLPEPPSSTAVAQRSGHKSLHALPKPAVATRPALECMHATKASALPCDSGQSALEGFPPTWMRSLCSPSARLSFLQSLARTVEIPRSMPDLTTERLLVMSFVEGDQITRLEHRTKDLSARFGCFCSYQCTSAAVITCAFWPESLSIIAVALQLFRIHQAIGQCSFAYPSFRSE